MDCHPWALGNGHTMSTINSPTAESHAGGHYHSSPFTHGQAGILAFLLSEVAFFGTLIMTYVFFLRQTVRSEPGPGEVFSLRLVIFGTVCLLSSSVTIHMAEKKLHAGAQKAFLGWFALTILLGAIFITGTALEWRELIYTHNLTISRNMFGTTYFTLVGFHATHVTVGLIVMSILLFLGFKGHVNMHHAHGLEMTAWYWHFVDAVWVVVFLLVYIIGR